MKFLHFFTLYIVLTSATCTQNTNPFNSSVPCTSIIDVKYQTGNSFCGQSNLNHQNFDIYIPQTNLPNNALKPLVIYIHGGKFTGGNKNNIPNFISSNINNVLQNNIAFATINYQLLSMQNGCTNETCGVRDKCLDDVARCIKFIKANATTYGIDKNRIGLIGSSAGGTAAQWIAFDGFENIYGSQNTHYGILALDNETTKVKAIYTDIAQASLDIREWETPVFDGLCTTPNLSLSQILNQFHANINDPNFDCYLHAFYGRGNMTNTQLMNIPNISDNMEDVALLSMINNTSSPRPLLYFRNRNKLMLNNLNQLLHHPLHAYHLKETCQLNNFNTSWQIKHICNGPPMFNAMLWYQYFIANL